MKEAEELLGTYWNGWKLCEVIGRGSFGTVYRVEKNVAGVISESALKIIRVPGGDDDAGREIAEICRRNEQEMREYYRNQVNEVTREIHLMEYLSDADAPNIVRIEDFGIEESAEKIEWVIYIRMELLESLSSYLKRKYAPEGGIPPVGETVRMGISILKALEACEDQKIIHRDIKPENIFRRRHDSRYGNYKLGDFGIARYLGNEKGMAYSRKGTAPYMAPEMMRGKCDLTVDIYALGIVMYRFLNHLRFPFLPPPPSAVVSSDMEKAQVRRLDGEPVPYPAEGGDELGQIICTACEADPGRRFQSARAFRAALERWQQSHPEPGRAVGTVPKRDPAAAAKATGKVPAADMEMAPKRGPSAAASENRTDISERTARMAPEAAGDVPPRRSWAPVSAQGFRRENVPDAGREPFYAGAYRSAWNAGDGSSYAGDSFRGTPAGTFGPDGGFGAGKGADGRFYSGGETDEPRRGTGRRGRTAILLAVIAAAAACVIFLLISPEQSSRSYSVSFQANGGSGAMDEIRMTGEDVLPESEFTNSDYLKFMGWSVSKDSDRIAEAGDPLSGLLDSSSGRNLTLYAVWEPDAEAISAAEAAKDAGIAMIGTDYYGKAFYYPSETEGHTVFVSEFLNVTDIPLKIRAQFGHMTNDGSVALGDGNADTAGLVIPGETVFFMSEETGVPDSASQFCVRYTYLNPDSGTTESSSAGYVCTAPVTSDSLSWQVTLQDTAGNAMNASGGKIILLVPDSTAEGRAKYAGAADVSGGAAVFVSGDISPAEAVAGYRSDLEAAA